MRNISVFMAAFVSGMIGSGCAMDIDGPIDLFDCVEVDCAGHNDCWGVFNPQTKSYVGSYGPAFHCVEDKQLSNDCRSRQAFCEEWCENSSQCGIGYNCVNEECVKKSTPPKPVQPSDPSQPGAAMKARVYYDQKELANLGVTQISISYSFGLTDDAHESVHQPVSGTINYVEILVTMVCEGFWVDALIGNEWMGNRIKPTKWVVNGTEGNSFTMTDKGWQFFNGSNIPICQANLEAQQ